jgi:redox-sensitive bicupin YhaK (pirin superfamily)
VMEGAAEVRVLVGNAFGRTSSVKTFSKTIYLDVILAGAGRLELPPLAEELAIYVVDGEVSVDDQSVAVGTLAVLTPGLSTVLSCDAPARLVVIGGEPLDAHRYMWWNFVSSRKERIVQASNDWLAQGMGQVPGETEFIPLPERRFAGS